MATGMSPRCHGIGGHIKAAGHMTLVEGEGAETSHFTGGPIAGYWLDGSVRTATTRLIWDGVLARAPHIHGFSQKNDRVYNLMENPVTDIH